MSSSASSSNSKSKGVNGVNNKQDASSSPPEFWKYQSLLPSDVTLAMSKLSAVQNMMEHIWQEEGALYEETMEIPSRESRTRRRIKVPRRNYAVAQGTVQDPRMFPYHSACYPLLDAYDALYPDGLGQPRHYANAVPPSLHDAVDESIGLRSVLRRVLEEGEVPVPGYLGNSWNALCETFLDHGGDHESSENRREELSEWRARFISYHQVFDLLRWMHVRQYHADPKFWEHQVFGDATMIQNVNNSANENGENATAGAAVNGLDAEHHDTLQGVGERKYGLQYFPERSEDRFKILLRLLKHALSELQRDHRLAEMALHTIITAHGCDRIDVFQYLLVVLQSEYLLFCDGECHHRAAGNIELRRRHGHGAEDEEDDDDDDEEEGGLYPDHFCNDWINLHSIMPLIISGGITWVTNDHANVLAAFVRRLYDAAGTPDPLLEATEPSSASAKPGAKQKLLLKQTLYYNRNTDWEDSDDEQRPDDSGIPYEFIRDLVLGVGAHALMDLQTLQQLKEVLSEAAADQDEESGLLELIEKTAGSYQNCIKALVDIGETSFRRLPSNSRSAEMCGCLVRALVMALIPLPSRNEVDVSPQISYLSRLDSGLLESMISPKRYSDAITHATERFLQQKASAAVLNDLVTTTPEPSNRVQHTLSLVDAMLAQPPPDDVKDLIRSLFARRVVEIRSSGCGYGDFLSWCGLPVDAADPLLFFHYFNYPAEDDNDEENEDGEEQEEPNYQWEDDEKGHQLTKREHWARYDFTLLALLRAWYTPWTPESHHSFSPAFRTAVRTLTLCAHRVGAPGDVAVYVSQFLHRDWFADERMQCWHQDCLNQNAQNLYMRKFQQRGYAVSSKGLKNKSSFEFCPTCHVSMYCSPEHKQSDDKDGHKWCCGRPPWKAPLSSKEEELCLEVFALMETSDPDSAAKEETSRHRHAEVVHLSDSQGAEDDEGDGDDDDEGSWESIDSNEDNQGPPSLTDFISKFFEKKVYKQQGW